MRNEIDYRINRVRIYGESYSQPDWARFIERVAQEMDGIQDVADTEHEEHVLSLENQINELQEAKEALEGKLERVLNAVEEAKNA